MFRYPQNIEQLPLGIACKSITMNTMLIAYNDNCEREPQYGSDAAAGLDLYSPIDITIPCNSNVVIDTGVRVRPPVGYYCQVRDRSSMGIKNVIVAGGIIDSDYTGSIGVILTNVGTSSYNVVKGSKIAQLIVSPYIRVVLETVSELPATKRAGNGFGSTGI